MRVLVLVLVLLVVAVAVEVAVAVVVVVVGVVVVVVAVAVVVAVVVGATAADGRAVHSSNFHFFFTCLTCIRNATLLCPLMSVFAGSAVDAPSIVAVQITDAENAIRCYGPCYCPCCYTVAVAIILKSSLLLLDYFC